MMRGLRLVGIRVEVVDVFLVVHVVYDAVFSVHDIRIGVSGGGVAVTSTGFG